MTKVPLHDLHPELDELRREVVEGLRASPKQLPCKLLYDELGSELFERICELPEYYPTRTEISILRESLGEMARLLGPECLVVEFGSGAGDKTLLLLDALDDPVAYVPIDISRDTLRASAGRLQSRYPEIAVVPVCADYTSEIALPHTEHDPRRRVVFFPGSTIGNFDPIEAVAFLRHVVDIVGPGGALLIGVDLPKDRGALEKAYDDAAGVTARFNKNMLARLNRELGANFRLDRFRHHAPFNEEESRVEMHLVSLEDQEVRIDGETFPLRKGESIWTESSYKYGFEQFRAMARDAGLHVQEIWTDPARRFSVQYLTVPV